MRVTAFACYAVAGMFVVYAVWAAFGLVFPAEPLPLALNVISKIFVLRSGNHVVCVEGGRGSQQSYVGALSARSAKRRVSPVAPRPREGPLTEPTAGAQTRPKERVLMPRTCRS
jgi:hypothetical protein